MNIAKTIILLILVLLVTSCVGKQKVDVCPDGFHWDEIRSVCLQDTKKIKTLDFSAVDLEAAVDIAINLVKTEPNSFNTAFANLISVAQKNPDIKNSKIILRFINAVALDAPYVPAKEAKIKWNQYFSPYFYVCMAYKYDTIKNYCDDYSRIIAQIDEELAMKKIGILKCLANQKNNKRAREMFKQAKDAAESYKLEFYATCTACSTNKSLM